MHPSTRLAHATASNATLHAAHACDEQTLNIKCSCVGCLFVAHNAHADVHNSNSNDAMNTSTKVCKSATHLCQFQSRLSFARTCVHTCSGVAFTQYGLALLLQCVLSSRFTARESYDVTGRRGSFILAPTIKQKMQVAQHNKARWWSRRCPGVVCRQPRINLSST